MVTKLINRRSERRQQLKTLIKQAQAKGFKQQLLDAQIKDDQWAAEFRIRLNKAGEELREVVADCKWLLTDPRAVEAIEKFNKVHDEGLKHESECWKVLFEANRE